VPIEGDPAQILGEPDGVDTFDTKGNWTLFPNDDNDCFRSEITDGRYWMESKGMAGIICWEVSWPLIENFYIETEVNMPETCQPNDRFGMLFRAPDNYRGYQFGLTCDGQYYMSSWDGEKTSVIVEPARSEAIIVGPGETNRMVANTCFTAMASFWQGLLTPPSLRKARLDITSALPPTKVS
jgi:hypothetical protein